MDHDWGEIYLYIATKTYQRWGKNEMPVDVAVDSINDYQMTELNRLKEVALSQEDSGQAGPRASREATEERGRGSQKEG